MQTRDIAELAAVAAEHGPLLIRGPAVISTAAIDQYWLTSKYRLDAWGRTLKRFSAVFPPNHAPTSRAPTIGAIVEEILVGELLTRVWAGVLCGYDRQRKQCEFEPIARSVHTGHLEARNRALRLLMHAPGVRVEEAVSLNKLRQRVEHWTDLLIGRLSHTHDVSEFACDPRRAREFARDLREEEALSGSQTAWNVSMSAMRAAFHQSLHHESPHFELNARIGAAVLGCFPPDVFDSVGRFQSLWALRLFTTTTDAEGMIEALADLDSPRRFEPSESRLRPYFEQG